MCNSLQFFVLFDFNLIHSGKKNVDYLPAKHIEKKKVDLFNFWKYNIITKENIEFTFPSYPRLRKPFFLFKDFRKQCVLQIYRNKSKRKGPPLDTDFQKHFGVVLFRALFIYFKQV